MHKPYIYTIFFITFFKKTSLSNNHIISFISCLNYSTIWRTFFIYLFSTTSLQFIRQSLYIFKRLRYPIFHNIVSYLLGYRLGYFYNLSIWTAKEYSCQYKKCEQYKRCSYDPRYNFHNIHPILLINKPDHPDSTRIDLLINYSHLKPTTINLTLCFKEYLNACIP